MANTVDRVKQDIQARLNEIEAERDQLMRALSALTGGGSTVRRGRGRPPSSASKSGDGRKRSGKRAARGQRRRQVLDVLKGNELGPSAIAREIGVNPTQISGLLRQLASAGEVTRTAGGKWRLTAASEMKASGGGDQAAGGGGPGDGGGEGSSPGSEVTS